MASETLAIAAHLALSACGFLPYHQFVTYYWRRQVGPLALREGDERRTLGGGFLRETARGRIVESAMFDLEPVPGTAPAWQRGAPRLNVQVRVDVSLRNRGRTPRGEWTERTLDDCIALSVWGGREDRRYTWVQAYSDQPETVIRADGTRTIEDAAFDGERPLVGQSGFHYAGREWYVDAGSDASARYADRGYDLSVAPNGEVIYDSPNSELVLGPWLRDRPDVMRLERTMQFQSYAFELPGMDPTVRIPRHPVVAVVAWSRDEVYTRDSLGGPARRVSPAYYVHFVVPNAAVPAALTTVLWRTFLGH
ncbi:MAG: hypothetical protein AB7S26_40250 [Sandaracinaceae bacterium]